MFNQNLYQGGNQEFMLDRLNKELHEKLRCNKLKIIFERRIVKQAEDLLARYRKSLEAQTDSLVSFIKEGDRLEEELSECMGYEFSGGLSNDLPKPVNTFKEKIPLKSSLKRKYPDNVDSTDKNGSQTTVTKLPLLGDISNGCPEGPRTTGPTSTMSFSYNDTFVATGDTVQRNVSSNVLYYDAFPEENDDAVISSNNNELHTLAISGNEGATETKEEKQCFKRMELPHLKNVVIYSIFQKGELGIFIGGSDGFLMKSSDNNEVFLYETYVTDDITQIEMMVFNKVPVLIAVTRDKILLFNDLNRREPSKEIDLPPISEVYNEGNLLFITLANGFIKKMNKSNWIVFDHYNNDSRKFLFVPTVNSKYKLLTLKDNSLYRSSNKDLSGFQKIRGISNVKMVSRVKVDRYLCYSDYMIWFLNEECEITDSMRFNDRIKLFNHDNNIAAVVDFNDVVHVYHIQSSGTFGDKIEETPLESPVTAVLVSRKMVYVAVKDSIFSLRCCPLYPVPVNEAL